jgi:hypothetical protein
MVRICTEELVIYQKYSFLDLLDILNLVEEKLAGIPNWFT